MGEKRIRLYLLYRAPTEPARIAAQLHGERKQGIEPVLLVPDGRQAGTGLLEIPFQWRDLSPAEVTLRLVASLGVENDVPAILVAPSSADLVIDLARKRVWLFGIEIPLGRAEQPFKYVSLVAIANGRPVSKEQMLKHLSPAGCDEAVGRKAKWDFKEAVTAAFKQAGRELPKSFGEVFPSRGGEFMTTLEPFVWPPAKWKETATNAQTVA